MRQKILNIVDHSGFFFFIILMWFLPMSNAAIEVCFGGILLCAILRGFFTKNIFSKIEEFFSKRINLSALAFFFAFGLSILVSGELLAKSMWTWIFGWGECLLFFYLAQVFIKRKHIKILLLVFCASGLLVCIDGLYQKINGVDFLRGFSVLSISAFDLPQFKGIQAITASFRHYNDFGGFLTVLFFVALGFLISKGFRIKIKIGIAGLLVLIMGNLLFTYSRGAWISFLFAGILFFVFLPFKKSKFILVSILLLFGIVLVCNISLFQRFLFIFHPYGDANRFHLWKVAFDIFKSAPFLGKGIGTFMHYTAYLGPQYAHNCYLQILAETGIVGFSAFMWFLIEVLARGFKKIMKNKDVLFMGVFFAIIAFLIHSFFDTHLFSLKLSKIFWVLMSFLAIYVYFSEDNTGLENGNS